MPAGLPAGSGLLLLGGPSAVSGFIVPVRIRVAVYCHSMWSFPHVTKEHPKVLAPAFADSNAASAVILKLWMVPVCASLDHFPPTVVRGSVALASQCSTAT